jgi:hypothetical protein
MGWRGEAAREEAEREREREFVASLSPRAQRPFPSALDRQSLSRPPMISRRRVLDRASEKIKRAPCGARS